MRAIDTNVLVRLIVRDDPRQAEIADSYVAKGAWVSHLVLAEAIWVLSAVYDLDDSRIAATVEGLMQHQSLSIQEPDVVAGALAGFRGKSAPEFADCLVLEIARKAGHIPLGTFDRKLGKLPGAERL
ncbi:MAG: PIN domain-containing protein [Betaproteobacteria bacterium]